QHLRCLLDPPARFARENARAEDVQKTVHLCLDAVVKKPDGMMKPGGKLDRHLGFRRGNEGMSDLHALWKRVSRRSAGAKLVPERSRRMAGVMACKRSDSFLCAIGWRFPKRLQFQRLDQRTSRDED